MGQQVLFGGFLVLLASAVLLPRALPEAVPDTGTRSGSGPGFPLAFATAAPLSRASSAGSLTSARSESSSPVGSMWTLIRL